MICRFLYFLVFIQCYGWLLPDNDEINGIIGFSDSDSFLLKTGSSSLPIENIGEGVFTKQIITQGGIICEYRGPMIASKDRDAYSNSNLRDKMISTRGPDGLSYVIIGQNICAKINDCTSILNKSYTQEEVNELDKTKKVPSCFDGFSYNAKSISNPQTGNLISSYVIVISSRLMTTLISI